MTNISKSLSLDKIWIEELILMKIYEGKACLEIKSKIPQKIFTEKRTKIMFDLSNFKNIAINEVDTPDETTIINENNDGEHLDTTTKPNQIINHIATSDTSTLQQHYYNADNFSITSKELEKRAIIDKKEQSIEANKMTDKPIKQTPKPILPISEKVSKSQTNKNNSKQSIKNGTENKGKCNIS
jgi:hypothetical protein